MSDTSFEKLRIHGAELSRRGLLAIGGALVVSAALSPSNAQPAARVAAEIDAALPASWIEIHADNTIVMRTGKCDFGMGSIYTAYRQIVAEELGVTFEAITTVVAGDTDLTPDGGPTAGMLRTNVLNLRKVAAYTREALLKLAAERFKVATADLAVEDGVITGAGKKVSYGELVSGQQLNLRIPVSGELTTFRGLTVEGDPPFKPVSSYRIIGKSYKNSNIASKVSTRETWITNVRPPGMLHARIVHPPTLGSQLISVGQLDRSRFPNAEVVVIGNLVGVVAPDEWEAIRAAQGVARDCKWTAWSGLPTSENLHEYLREEADWNTTPVSAGPDNGGDVPTALRTAAKVHAATYLQPYHKHAPIGPTVAVADVRPDGMVTLHAHSQNPQFLRGQIAQMLGVSTDKVIVKEYSGSGHYGRSNGGNAGGEDEAVLLSRAVGRPVRVQWMRQEDMQWSTQHAASFSDIRIGLSKAGRMVAYDAIHHMPAMQDDRPIGAVLAGLPTMPAPAPHQSGFTSTSVVVNDRWLYNKVRTLNERSHGTWQVGQRESPLAVGLRDHSMRTPIQFQQNFPREVAISEAAALAGADPLQFRIDHTEDERLIDILQRLRLESGWIPHAAPSVAAAQDNPILHGQGVSIMFRANAYWACACKIAVTPATGKVAVKNVTLVVDPGIVVNPLQLKRQVEAGCLMGVSQALLEEVTFDQGAVTSRDWASYPILTMADIPEVKVVLVHRADAETYGQGSEGANALPPPAIAAAFLDATGRTPRKLPLRPDYVKRLLAV